MATYSTTAIVNKALVLCGATTISSITDDTPNARALNAVYEIARKAILCECGWSFALTRSTLSTAGALTLVAWTYTSEAYVYSRPSAALRIVDVSDSDAIWREEGDYIVSDTNNLGAKYVFDQSDPSKWSPFFVAAFIDKLASDICFMILNSTQKAEAFLAKYEKVSLPRALAENSQTGTQQLAKDDAWEVSKLSNGSRPDRSYSS